MKGQYRELSFSARRIKVKIEGFRPERLLEQAAEKGLELRNVRYTCQTCILCVVTPEDLKGLRRIAGARYMITELERKGPGYSVQRNVTVDGEVLFAGEYSLNVKNERLSSLIERAGGITAYGYTKGAKLTRVANDDEKKRMNKMNCECQEKKRIDIKSFAKCKKNHNSDRDLRDCIYRQKICHRQRRGF